MKARILLTSIMLFISFSLSSAQYSVDWKEINEGLKLAKEQNKIMLVSFYTDWCKWCKKMENTTYSNKDVVSKITKNFIAVKLNPEKPGNVNYMGRDIPYSYFKQGSRVQGFPATVFFSPDGSLITTIPGYREPDDFLETLEYFESGLYSSLSIDDYTIFKAFQQQIKQKPNDPELNFALGFFYHDYFDDLKKAEDHYKKAIKGKNPMPEAYMRLAELEAGRKNKKKSKEYFSKAIDSGFVSIKAIFEKVGEIIKNNQKI